MTTSYSIIAHEATAVAYAIFFGFMLFQPVRNGIAFLFISALVCTALWAQGFVLAAYDLLPVSLFAVLPISRDGAWLAFAVALMGWRHGRARYVHMMVAAVAALVLAQLIFVAAPVDFGAVAGVRLDSALLRVCTSIVGFILIENVLRNAPRPTLWALKHWAIGFGSIYAFQLAIRIPEFLTHRVSTSTALATPLMFLIAVPFFVISSTRLPQLQTRLHTSRAVVFHSATVVLAGILLQGIAFAAWYVRSYGGTNGVALALTLVFAGVIGVLATAASGSMRSRLRHFINRHFFSLKYDYRLEWERCLQGLAGGQERPAAARALAVLDDLMDCPTGGIWMYRESWGQFLPAAKIGSSVHEITLPADDERVKFIDQHGGAFIEIASATAAARSNQFACLMEDGWLAIPLRYQSSLVGFAVLGKPRAPRTLDWEDIGLVRLVSMQLASFLMQEETAQSLADGRQLADFNKRFAFVVHDIKNTIGQLSLLVGNIGRFGDQKGFRDDMIVTLSNSVNRLQVLLSSLTDVGSAVSSTSPQKGAIDLNELLRNFTGEKRRAGRTILLKDTNGPAVANVVEDVVVQVLEHVVTNALEASGPETPVEIRVVPRPDSIEVTVEDRGPGMTQKFINEELFRPLKSTKVSGFGVGAYQMRELMRDLGGEVAVHSVIGKGTRVTLTFPRAQRTRS